MNPTLTVYLEPTDVCNAKCLYCIHETDESPHGRPKGYMTYETWTRLVDELVAMKADGTITERIDLRPYWFGESFIHPDYDKMLRYLARFDFADEFLLATNGTDVDARYIDILLDYAQAQPKTQFFLTYGIDALDPEIMWAIKRVKKASTVMENIAAMLDARAVRGVPNLHLIFQTIVMPQNAAHTPVFVDHWRRELSQRQIDYAEGHVWSPAILKDYIWVKMQVAPGAQDGATALFGSACRDANIPLVERQIPTMGSPPDAGPRVRKPCGMAWQLTVCWDGTVTPCCVDPKCQLEIGNIHEQSLRAIYTGRKAAEVRMAHVTGDLTPYPVCDQCECPYLGGFSGDYWIPREKISRSVEAAAKLGLPAALRLLDQSPDALPQPV